MVQMGGVTMEAWPMPGLRGTRECSATEFSDSRLSDLQLLAAIGDFFQSLTFFCPTTGAQDPLLPLVAFANHRRATMTRIPLLLLGALSTVHALRVPLPRLRKGGFAAAPPRPAMGSPPIGAMALPSRPGSLAKVRVRA